MATSSAMSQCAGLHSRQAATTSEDEKRVCEPVACSQAAADGTVGPLGTGDSQSDGCTAEGSDAPFQTNNDREFFPISSFGAAEQSPFATSGLPSSSEQQLRSSLTKITTQSSQYLSTHANDPKFSPTMVHARANSFDCRGSATRDLWVSSTREALEQEPPNSAELATHHNGRKPIDEPKTSNQQFIPVDLVKPFSFSYYMCRLAWNAPNRWEIYTFFLCMLLTFSIYEFSVGAIPPGVLLLIVVLTGAAVRAQESYVGVVFLCIVALVQTLMITLYAALPGLGVEITSLPGGGPRRLLSWSYPAFSCFTSCCGLLWVTQVSDRSVDWSSSQCWCFSPLRGKSSGLLWELSFHLPLRAFAWN